jgi:D-beta-D-heptose 7-phosphate kinase/D-beta-D-heptose 1-phosphate adenosyltransferase
MSASSCGFDSHPRHQKMGYILEEKLLIDIANSQRSRGSKIVFTHGAFDLFHVGHLELIKKSLKLGDILIVGVDSDERIAQYKSPHRPVIKHAERMKILSHLECVNFVLPLRGKIDAQAYINLYLKLNPDVITHGAVFGAPKDQLLTREKRLGIQIKQINHKFSHLTVSTTKIIDSILKMGVALVP